MVERAWSATSSTSSEVSSLSLLGTSIRVAVDALNDVARLVAEAAPAHTYAIVTDERVSELYGPRVIAAFRALSPAPRIIFRAVPAGEERKTRDTWGALTDWMLAEGCGRDTTVIALGGGVIGDLAGFVAATFMRGIAVVQVPTTLLAMVDASIGGKTGVDTIAGKNLVGAFHQPALVLIDPATLVTLDAARVRGGMAEMLKHGAIADAAYFSAVAAFGATLQRERDREERASSWQSAAATSLISRSVAIKASIVIQDSHESGVREILNAGHTVGHAIELVSRFTIAHGDAVAIGLVAEGVLGELLGITAAGTAGQLRHALGGTGLPTSLPQGMAADDLVAAMRHDKKTRRGAIRIPLLTGIGLLGTEHFRASVEVDPAAIRTALDRSTELAEA